MAAPRKRGRLEKGKSVAAQLGRAVVSAHPVGAAALGVAHTIRGGGSGEKAGHRKTRTKQLFMRKGRVFMGFSQKEVKMALRSRYGGRRTRR